MPTPNAGESRDDFVSRCIPIVLDDGTADDNDQAVAICMSMYEQRSRRAVGDCLKTLAKTEELLRVQNHIVLFGGRDLELEYFDAETDLESDYTRSIGRLPIDFEHGHEVDYRAAPDGERAPGRDDVLGYTDWSTAQRTDLGWLVESVLDRRNRYVQAFEPLIDAGLIGTSSQAIGDLVEVEETGRIARWPLQRNSLTVEPAEPRMLGVNALTAIKSLCDLLPEYVETFGPVLEAAGKPQPGEGDGDDGADNGKTIIHTEENTNMGDETPTTQEPEVKALSDRLDQIGATLDRVLDYIESDPAARRAGLVAPGSEDKAAAAKSFADFLIAVRYGDMKRLEKVYKTRIDRKAFAEKDLSGTVGSTAGVLVPEEYSRELLKVDDLLSPVMGMVQTVPVTTDSGTYPALDQYITPTAGSGQTAAAAGITVANVAAGEELTETNVGFTQLKWLISKVGGVVDVENELMDDSPFAVEALLKQLFRIAIQSKNERNVFRGLGVGEPLGILNSAAAIPITPDADNTFAYADALEMLTRFRPVGKPAWFIHPSIWTDIGVFESSGGGGVWQANYQGQLGRQLLNYPIYAVEHLPQANSSGCVVLADLAAYVMFLRSVLAIAYSEHYKFANDMGVWRFTQRNDGKPWTQGPIVLADPQGSFTISPFVYLND